MGANSTTVDFPVGTANCFPTIGLSNIAGAWTFTAKEASKK
jgi:hypothetical protein